MPIKLKPEYLKRYKDLAGLFLKYGRSDLLTTAGLEQVLTEDERKAAEIADPKTTELAEDLADDLERMGPIYVKLGQVLSSRADLLPPPYLKSLSRLQDHLEPFSFAEVEDTVQSELGVRISKAFQEFESEPLAVASLGQVHRAVLRNGRPVVVKVQRPGIRKTVADDLEVLEDLAHFLDEHTEVGKLYGFSDLLREFAKNLARELDYQQEAGHLRQIGGNLKEFPNILVPSPVDDYTTSRVLTMDYVSGQKITELGPLAHLEMDGTALAEELFSAYLKQFLVDGLFHADPHPGNVFVTDDRKVALIDLGMVGRISPTLQEQMLKLLIAIGEGQADQVADIGIGIGQPMANFDEQEFRGRVAELVAHQQRSNVGNLRIGSVFTSFTQATGASGIRMPSELTMFGKTLLNLDEIGCALDPKFDPNDAIRRNTAQIMRQKMFQSLTPGHLLSSFMEAREFATELPSRVNRILDALAKNQLKFEVEAIDEVTLIEGFQKVANRITTGLILAALIIGASQLMQIKTKFTLFGYPGLAMLCFLAAAGGGFWLVITILLSDRRSKEKSAKG
jgi:predicted unusual protein kinase regulating ubiquinone biosynthesis (AarF/ABC1/UbiB family)